MKRFKIMPYSYLIRETLVKRNIRNGEYAELCLLTNSKRWRFSPAFTVQIRDF